MSELESRGLLSRRSFLAAAATVAATATVLPGEAGAAPEAPLAGRVKKAVIWNMFQSDQSVADKFKTLKALGFDGIEARVGDRVDPAEMRAGAEAAGVAIHSVMLGSVDNINGAVDLAKTLGAGAVLLVAGRVNESMPYKENYERTQAIIRESIPHAEAQEIYLLVENVWNNFLLSPLEMARYIDELDSPWVAAYFDVGNVVRFGYPEHWIPVLGERIKRVHIKEYSRDKQLNEGLWKGFEVEMGEGSIDWPAVRQSLIDIDYRGWITAEVGGGGEARMRDISERMDQVLALA